MRALRTGPAGAAGGSDIASTRAFEPLTHVPLPIFMSSFHCLPAYITTLLQRRNDTQLSRLPTLSSIDDDKYGTFARAQLT